MTRLEACLTYNRLHPDSVESVSPFGHKYKTQSLYDDEAVQLYSPPTERSSCAWRSKVCFLALICERPEFPFYLHPVELMYASLFYLMMLMNTSRASEPNCSTAVVEELATETGLRLVYHQTLRSPSLRAIITISHQHQLCKLLLYFLQVEWL